MNVLNIPNETFVRSMRENVSNAMNNRFCIDESSGSYGQKVCVICDCFVTVDNPPEKMLVSHLASYCERSGANIDHLISIFPENLVNEYRNDHPVLRRYAVSTQFSIFKEPVTLFSGIEEEFVHVCKLCHNIWKKDTLRSGRSKIACPARSVWNGNLIGEAPSCLKVLSIAELAILSPNRIITHGIVLYADQHRGVYGWHALYENNVSANVSNIQQLVDAGLNGDIVCVLCGPFTRAQHAVVRNQFLIRNEKIKEAFLWLKANNHFYKDIEMPDMESIKQPVLLYNDDL